MTKISVEEVNIGIVQMRVTTDLNTNLKNIIFHIRHASLRRINLLCFPECSLTGYIVNHVKLNYKAISQSVNDLQEESTKSNVSILIGTPWKSRGKIFNTAFVIKPKFGIIKKYYK